MNLLPNLFSPLKETSNEPGHPVNHMQSCPFLIKCLAVFVTYDNGFSVEFSLPIFEEFQLLFFNHSFVLFLYLLCFFFLSHYSYFSILKEVLRVQILNPALILS